MSSSLHLSVSSSLPPHSSPVIHPAILPLMTAQCVLTIGNFDGVHLGHRAILARAAEAARLARVKVTALSFDPHPAAVLRPGQEPPRLTTLAQKTQCLRDAGADEVVVLEPSPQLLSLSPREFIEQLVQRHAPAAMVEGPDFRFGKGRAGDVRVLAELGAKLGYETIIVEDAEIELSDHTLAPLSSSLIRWLLRHGRIADAARCLGRPYELSATVVRGDQRGRTIGVPTANLDPVELAGRALPGDGVYAGSVVLADGTERPAAISVGAKPTFAGRGRVIEAHALDYHGDLYGQVIAVRLTRWLRDQQSFPGVAELKAQLQRDVAEVRRFRFPSLLGRG